MSMSDPLNHLGSEPSDVPYSPNQFLGLEFFFATSNSKRALVTDNYTNEYDNMF